MVGCLPSRGWSAQMNSVTYLEILCFRVLCNTVPFLPSFHPPSHLFFLPCLSVCFYLLLVIFTNIMTFSFVFLWKSSVYNHLSLHLYGLLMFYLWLFVVVVYLSYSYLFGLVSVCCISFHLIIIIL